MPSAPNPLSIDSLDNSPYVGDRLRKTDLESQVWWGCLASPTSIEVSNWWSYDHHMQRQVPQVHCVLQSPLECPGLQTGLVEVVRKVVIEGKVGSGICSGLTPGTSLVSPWPLDSAAGPCPAEQALFPAGSGCEPGLGPREASPALPVKCVVRQETLFCSDPFLSG